MATETMDISHKPVSVHQRGSSFPVRRMDFDFTDINLHFIADDPACSHVWSSFQAFFPEGEQFFVDAVRDAKHLVKDPALLAEISAFIGQEAMHGKEHLEANNEYRRQGINLDMWGKRTRWARKKLNKMLSVKARLAGTAAVEHFTAVVAEHLMNREDFQARLTDPRAKTLIFWHATEESEHRAVSFDVYKTVGGTYWMRVIAMAIVMIGIGPVVAAGLIDCLRQEGNLKNWKSWRKFGRVYFGWNGFVTRMIPDLLKYYKPGFHPAQSDVSERLAYWQKQLGLA